MSTHRLRRDPSPLLAVLCLTLCGALPAFPARPETAQRPSERIPNVRGNTLAGQPVDLPAQLRGRTAVLVLGFSKDARIPVRDWGQRLAGDFATSSTVSYFEMPVLASVPRLLRGFVLRQIAADVSDRGKPHFVAITADEPRWRTLAHYNRPGDAYILVVDSDGNVRATLNGPFSARAYSALQRNLAEAVAAVLPPSGAH